MAGRLRDLGFEPDAVVSCVLQKARGNIAAYLVRGAVIALREEDSRFVFVEPRIFEIKESLKPPAEVPDKAVCEVTAVHEVTS